MGVILFLEFGELVSQLLLCHPQHRDLLFVVLRARHSDFFFQGAPQQVLQQHEERQRVLLPGEQQSSHPWRC